MFRKITRYKLFLPLLATAVLALAIAGFFAVRSGDNNESSDQFLPKAEQGEEAAPSPPPGSPTSPSVPPGTASEPTESENIVVTTPSHGDKLGDGSNISGQAKVPDGRLHYRVKGTQSGQLLLGSVNIGGDGSKMTPFSFEIFFEKQPQPGESGALEVFNYNANGNEVNNVTISVKF